ncbi:MAG: helix-turn-helix domain-containing protein [Dongiaceae bacterium]
MVLQLSIGDLAKATGTKVETIRYYERVALLPAPARTAANYRSYDASHLARLGFIRRSRELGFSIEEVRDLLSLSDQKDRSCAEVDVIARKHLEDVDARIATLQKLRHELDAIIRRCHSDTIADCRIIEALAPQMDASSEAAKRNAGRARH